MFEIKKVHIELTDKCQAQCPMCARNHNGGNDRKHITNNDVSINQFKEWFPESFIQKLDLFYASGNYGDPAFAKDCLGGTNNLFETFVCLLFFPSIPNKLKEK